MLTFAAGDAVGAHGSEMPLESLEACSNAAVKAAFQFCCQARHGGKMPKGADFSGIAQPAGLVDT